MLIDRDKTNHLDEAAGDITVYKVMMHDDNGWRTPVMRMEVGMSDPEPGLVIKPESPAVRYHDPGQELITDENGDHYWKKTGQIETCEGLLYCFPGLAAAMAQCSTYTTGNPFLFRSYHVWEMVIPAGVQYVEGRSRVGFTFMDSIGARELRFVKVLGRVQTGPGQAMLLTNKSDA